MRWRVAVAMGMLLAGGGEVQATAEAQELTPWSERVRPWILDERLSLETRRALARAWQEAGESERVWQAFAAFKKARGMEGVWRMVTYENGGPMVAPEAVVEEERKEIEAYWLAQFAGHWLSGRVAGAAVYGSLVKAWCRDDAVREATLRCVAEMSLEDEAVPPEWQPVLGWLRGEVGPFDRAWAARGLSEARQANDGTTWPSVLAVWLKLRHGDWATAKREAERVVEACAGNASVRRYLDALLKSAASAGDPKTAEADRTQLDAWREKAGTSGEAWRALADGVEAMRLRQLARLAPAGVLRGEEQGLAARLAEARWQVAMAQGRRGEAELALRRWEGLDDPCRPAPEDLARLTAWDDATEEDRRLHRAVRAAEKPAEEARVEVAEALRRRGESGVNQLSVIWWHFNQGDPQEGKRLLAAMVQRRRYLARELSKTLDLLQNLDTRRDVWRAKARSEQQQVGADLAAAGAERGWPTRAEGETWRAWVAAHRGGEAAGPAWVAVERSLERWEQGEAEMREEALGRLPMTLRRELLVELETKEAETSAGERGASR